MNESNETLNTGKGLNFAVALMIARQKGNEYWVEAKIDGVRRRFRMVSATSYIRDDYPAQIVFDGKNNWASESVRIVREGDGWSEPVTMKGWQLCAEADRRAKAGEDVRVRIDLGTKVSVYAWSPKSVWLFHDDDGVIGPDAGKCYCVQWPADELQDVTEEVVQWWAGQIVEGLK